MTFAGNEPRASFAMALLYATYSPVRPVIAADAIRRVEVFPVPAACFYFPLTVTASK